MIGEKAADQPHEAENSSNMRWFIVVIITECVACVAGIIYVASVIND